MRLDYNKKLGYEPWSQVTSWLNASITSYVVAMRFNYKKNLATSLDHK